MDVSDVEKDDSIRASDMSGATTDDEFFNEMMAAPAEFEDCLIPDQCKNEVEGIEHLTKCLNRRFNAYPVVFMGTLKEALKEALGPKEITERRPLLIYVNNDKSIYTNLFCKQLLCNEKIIEYLMDNYVLWAWDVTYESNGQKLNNMCKPILTPWTSEKEFQTSAIDRYPLLLAVYREINGDYHFDRLIEGPDKKFNLEEFLVSLTEFKEKFNLSEIQLEKAKEDAKQKMLLDALQFHDIRHRSKHHKDRHFLRSVSMLPHMGYDDDVANLRNPQFTRLLSHDINMRRNLDELFSNNPLSREDLMRSFEGFHADSDDADDEDDDRTPTVEHPMPKFS